jgi:hypothetical protein
MRMAKTAITKFFIEFIECGINIWLAFSRISKPNVDFRLSSARQTAILNPMRLVGVVSETAAFVFFVFGIIAVEIDDF